MMKILATFAKWALVGFVALFCPPPALIAAVTTKFDPLSGSAAKEVGRACC
jgi:hypothetical protein